MVDALDLEAPGLIEALALEAVALEAVALEAVALEVLALEVLTLEALTLEALDFEALAFFVPERGGTDLAAGRAFLGAKDFESGFNLDCSLRVIFGMIRVY